VAKGDGGGGGGGGDGGGRLARHSIEFADGGDDDNETLIRPLSMREGSGAGPTRSPPPSFQQQRVPDPAPAGHRAPAPPYRKSSYNASSYNVAADRDSRQGSQDSRQSQEPRQLADLGVKRSSASDTFGLHAVDRTQSKAKQYAEMVSNTVARQGQQRGTSFTSKLGTPL
jgi:hypothetical protein